MWKIIVLFVCISQTALCSDCNTDPVKADLDFKQLSGWWYLHYRSNDHKGIDTNYKCLRQYWETQPDGNVFVTEANLPLEGPRTSEGGSFFGLGHVNRTDGLIYFDSWTKGEKSIAPSHVIDTDYTNFMAYSVCFGDGEITGKWILTRSHEEMNSDVMKKVEHLLEGIKMTLDQFTVVSQKPCP